ncbi:MAG: hypothetical protein FWG74_04015, partial [Planctomycetes bacterium]|nr:hypothetical protein [Planctomycetota bacterium]
MKIDNTGYNYASSNKSYGKMQTHTQKNITSSHKHGVANTVGNLADSLVISEEAKAINTPQLNRANAQHLWVEVNGSKVSTIVTADGIWMAKNGGIGREAYEWIDPASNTSDISQTTMQ